MRYRAPTLTWGRIHIRTLHVISPRRTPSRRRLVKITRRGACRSPLGVVRPDAAHVLADLLDEAHLGLRLVRNGIDVRVLDRASSLVRTRFPQRLAEEPAVRILEH